jgi:hypothetical protein
MDDFLRTSGTNGIVLQVYKDILSLASAWEGKDGKVNLRWAKEQKGRGEYAEKDIPVKITLGDQATATATLLMLLRNITGRDYTEVPFKEAL